MARGVRGVLVRSVSGRRRLESVAPALNARVDVALDLLRFRAISAGMAAYAEELAARLPRVAPDLRFATVVRTNALDLGEQVRVPRALCAVAPRLVHHLALYAPMFVRRPTIVTIHDLIHLRFPELFKRSVGPYYNIVVRAVCARAARVITDDDRTIADLERFLGVAPGKVVVVPLGVDDRFRADVEPRAFARPYFLYVGNHQPHKDLATLYAAWEALDPALSADLLLTGEDDLRPGDRPQRPSGEVRFLGDVGVEELTRLYRGAVALVHPALCEGFGLPMLEAATVGTAVIAAAEAVPAVLRPHVDVFTARDVRTLARLMSRALTAPAARDNARQFARTLTWDRCAAETAEVYRTVLQENPAR